eukprot:4900291-Alexandrium_andersonii.AAC.1
MCIRDRSTIRRQQQTAQANASQPQRRDATGPGQQADASREQPTNALPEDQARAEATSQRNST